MSDADKFQLDLGYLLKLTDAQKAHIQAELEQVKRIQKVEWQENSRLVLTTEPIVMVYQRKRYEFPSTQVTLDLLRMGRTHWLDYASCYIKTLPEKHHRNINLPHAYTGCCLGDYEWAVSKALHYQRFQDLGELWMDFLHLPNQAYYPRLDHAHWTEAGEDEPDTLHPAGGNFREDYFYRRGSDDGEWQREGLEPLIAIIPEPAPEPAPEAPKKRTRSRKKEIASA